MHHSYYGKKKSYMKGKSGFVLNYKTKEINNTMIIIITNKTDK